MSPLQIVAVVILGLGILTAVGFTVAFIVVSCKREKIQEETVVEPQKDEVSEIDLDQMLAKLEEASKKEEKEEPKKEEPKQEEPKQEEPKVIINYFEAKKEEKEEPEEKPVIIEEPVSEVKQETASEKPVEEAHEPETIIIDRTGPEFDYRIRLEKIKESQSKIDKDLDKTNRAILKYERTIRRMERNQKMLDRRALELTNLNLLMYSVTDIKNVDAEKKARQEELTAHIAELKASIQDAEEYIEANREKYESNLKLRDYLTHEQTRYADEVKELEALIAAGKFFDDGTDATGDNK